MKSRREFLKYLAASPLLTEYSAFAQEVEEARRIANFRLLGHPVAATLVVGTQIGEQVLQIVSLSQVVWLHRQNGLFNELRGICLQVLKAQARTSLRSVWLSLAERRHCVLLLECQLSLLPILLLAQEEVLGRGADRRGLHI